MPNITYLPEVELRFIPGDSGNPVCLRGPDTVAPGAPTVVFKLPESDGLLGYVLKTNGSGQWNFEEEASGTLPANVALKDATNVWTQPQAFNQIVYTGQYFSSIRTGTNGGGALSHVALEAQTDGKTVGDGSVILFEAKKSDDSIVVYAHMSMQIIDPTPGSAKAKLVFCTYRNTAVVEAMSIDWDGGVSSTYQRVYAGDPNTHVSAPIGAICHNTAGGAGTSFYVKESNPGGNTGWVAK